LCGALFHIQASLELLVFPFFIRL